MNAVSTDRVDHEPSLPMRRAPVEARTMTPMEMIARAVADGQPIEVIRELMAQHTGQPLERIEQDFSRDAYLTPQQAIEYGLIDAILEPNRVAR